MSPAQLARELDAKLPDVSYHIRQLVRFDCVELVETGQVRGAIEHFYAATERSELDTEEWLELVRSEPVVAEGLIDEMMQKILDDFVGSRRAGIVGMDEHYHITRTPMNLDHDGLVELVAFFLRCQDELAGIEERSALRRSETGADSFPVSASLLCFEAAAKSR